MRDWRANNRSERRCTVPGCDAVHVARGLCELHYKAMRRHGEPVKYRGNPALRFERSVSRDPVSGCWEWSGYRDPAGYGRFRIRNDTVMAHRWSYEHFVGPIPDDLTVDHLCRNKACCNPAHLEAVTLVENIQRGKRNDRNTHCRKGHRLEEVGTYERPNGRLGCSACLAASEARRPRNNR